MINEQISKTKNIGNSLTQFFHITALFVIGAVTVWSAFYAVVVMFYQDYATIQDILLLFIYLEIGAMVGIYFKTNHMPVRFLIYIGITALTRHLIDLVADGKEHMTEILVLGITVLILSFSVVLIRYASTKFPSDNKED
ncbi:MAG: phosphate-starvation-inducible protein PsiE [Alphaproteobacteria bacterium]|nr:phosphate-starvation-inducible protein PsiE [Alphaproteobacteria bacterium]